MVSFIYRLISSVSVLIIIGNTKRNMHDQFQIWVGFRIRKVTALEHMNLQNLLLKLTLKYNFAHIFTASLNLTYNTYALNIT